MEATAETRTGALLEQIRATENELRGQLERIHGCLATVERIHTDDLASFHGLLLTLRSSLDTVRAIERTGIDRVLESS